MFAKGPLTNEPGCFAMRVATAIGELLVAETDNHITHVTWIGQANADLPTEPQTPLLAEAARQLRAYGEGNLQDFDLPVRPEGSPFQQSVWQQMQMIPYGETRTYGDLAGALNSAARAVGRACGANPIPVIIPCHRVMGQNGKLTGFSGGEGVATKAELLALERRHAPAPAINLPLFTAPGA
jgi:methylated-DNA-[protein]-cysteine S-methyltransferase